VVLAAGLVNVVLSVIKPSATWLGEWHAAAMLAFDLLQLSAVLGLTGGLGNPFAVLLLVPVAVGAWALPGRAVWPLALLAALCVTVLAFWHLPLPGTGDRLLEDFHYALGTWTALVIAIGFIALALAAAAREERRQAQALEATRLALSREQRLSALGGLAAAAAHELGSPLATIAIVARELQKALPAEGPWQEDVALLREESDRCRTILGRLAADPREDAGEPYARLPLSGLIEAAAAPFRRDGVALVIEGPDRPAEAPAVPRDPAILHGLGTLIENAVEFASSEVRIEIYWRAPEVRVRIQDDGPGFDLASVASVGEPYFSTGAKGRAGDRQEQHMGLGVFIARTLLGHGGATLCFTNSKSGGATVDVVWPAGLPETGT
jgi:two-component system sensor histidine kinase RegB